MPPCYINTRAGPSVLMSRHEVHARGAAKFTRAVGFAIFEIE